jgi:molecular chaperone GrpE
MTDTDIEQTIEEQVETPGAGAPGEGGVPEGSATAGSEAQEVQDAEDAAEIEGELVEGELDELAVLAGERDQYLALAQRTQADFENYRKRVARESAAAQERGVAKLAKELLPALDNLDRALDAAATDDPLLDGVRLVRGELSAGLARVGIESFGAVGDTFDPVEHEAVAQQPVEGAESGSVVEVYQPGYRLGASVIRPARVLVAA